MLRTLNRILNIAAGSVIGVFVGHSLYVCWDYHAHPGLYAMQSAPWYTGIWVYGLFAAAALLVLGILKLVIQICEKKRESHEP